MENKQSSKLVTVILAVLLLLVAVYAFYANSENTKITLQLEAERTEIKAELDAMLVKLDAKSSENTALQEKLDAARKDIIAYKDTLSRERKASYNLIKKYKSRVYVLQAENKALLAQIDSLTAQNGLLLGEVTEAKKVIEAQTVANDSLTAENKDLAEKVALGSVLGINKLAVVSMKKGSDGSLSETSKYKKTDAFRISFTIEENQLADAGNKEVYFVIKDAKGAVVAPKGKIEIDGEEVAYSDSATIEFRNESEDVVTISPLDRSTTMKGNYIVEVYMTGRLVGVTKVKLRSSILGIF